ncbi:MAG: hypothetical protein IKE52_01395, partial [Mogibacterium sp.]|nr:hypothetical protein [Mogibacterium sp.]
PVLPFTSVLQVALPLLTEISAATRSVLVYFSSYPVNSPISSTIAKLAVVMLTSKIAVMNNTFTLL